MINRELTMDQRPMTGTVGRALGALAPDGQATFDGIVFQVRAEGGAIDSGLPVVVTGFDMRFLLVELAPPEGVAAQRRITLPQPPSPFRAGVLTTLGTLVLLLGLGLLIGNVTRMFPTIPYAGFVLMTIGGAILRA